MMKVPQITEAYSDETYSRALYQPVRLSPPTSAPMMYISQILTVPSTIEAIRIASSLSSARLKVNIWIIQPTIPGWSK